MVVKGVAAGLALAAIFAAVPVQAFEADTQFTQTAFWIPMTDAQRQSHRLAAKLCVPEEARGKSRLVLINHGSPASASDRPKMTLDSCNSEPAQWFLARGFAVLYALRRGYGATGGDWAENYGPCRNPDYARAGLESARDISAIVDYATRLPQIRPDGAVVAGVSAGGWATDAYDSVSHPKVVAMISMAGGRGGHSNGGPNSNCVPSALAQAAGVFGKTATTPMLWIYAQNDTYFRPQIANALYQAFTRSGGRTDFHAVGPNGDEGHYLWSADGGSETWGPLVENYLRQRGALNSNARNDPNRSGDDGYSAGRVIKN